MPSGALVTVPLPLPVLFTVSTYWFGENTPKTVQSLVTAPVV